MSHRRFVGTDGFLSAVRGLGGGAPLVGTLNSSETETSKALASLSTTSTVGFSSRLCEPEQASMMRCSGGYGEFLFNPKSKRFVYNDHFNYVNGAIKENAGILSEFGTCDLYRCSRRSIRLNDRVPRQPTGPKLGERPLCEQLRACRSKRDGSAALMHNQPAALEWQAGTEAVTSEETRSYDGRGPASGGSADEAPLADGEVVWCWRGDRCRAPLPG